MAWNDRQFNKGKLYFGAGVIAAIASLDETNAAYVGVTLDGLTLSLATGVQNYIAEETGIAVLGAIDQGVNVQLIAILTESDRVLARQLMAPGRVDSSGTFTYNAQTANLGNDIGNDSSVAKEVVFIADDTEGQTIAIVKAYPNMRRAAQIANRLQRPHLYPIVLQMIANETSSNGGNSAAFGKQANVITAMA